MVGGSALSTLLFAAVGALAGFWFGVKHLVLAGLVGIAAGGVLGSFAGAVSWECFDYLGEKCRKAVEARKYVAGTFWLIAALSTLLFSYAGLLWLLLLAARR